MNEQFLAYLWFQHLCNTTQCTADGQSVEIIDFGHQNPHAGPDVFNAKIKINGTLWAGNVEFHNHASDWYQHNHQTDARYDSVILHVVNDIDAQVCRTNGTPIPQLVLQFPDTILQRYHTLQTTPDAIRCAAAFSRFEPVRMSAWMDRLLVERLEQKTEQITRLLERTNNSWEDTFYILLARQFGFSVNADSFEQLALSLPNNILARHRNREVQIEALLFGQSGLLQEPVDEYSRILLREYRMLKSKYRLKPMSPTRWRWLRMRPANFPTIRLAQLAALILASHALFSQILETENIKQLYALFDHPASAYWQTHYNFGQALQRPILRMSNNTLNLIIINVVVPMLFAYGYYRNQEPLQRRAMFFLEQLPPESNSLIAPLVALGAPCRSAYESQALLQLRRYYCNENRCLQCRIGNRLLATSPEVS